MGFLLKQEVEGKEIIKLFYSKPEFGYYADDIMLVSKQEYDEYYYKQDYADFVFVNGWCDTTAELNSNESLGIDITDSFFLDCILQGQKLELNKPVEFCIK